MTLPKPPPYKRPAVFQDLWGLEKTNTLTVKGHDLAPPAPLSYLLERGPDSGGSPPLSFVGGQEQGPISLGSSGDFRIEGRGVLEVHGFVLFDGDGLYLCSADPESPLVADGKRISTEWNPVGVPCTLVFGRVRAVLRSAAVGPPSFSALPDFSSPQLESSEPATNPRASPSGPPPADDTVEPSTPYTGTPAVPPPRDASASGAYRPRVPSHSDDESTLIAPDRVNATGPQRVMDDDATVRAPERVRAKSVPDKKGDHIATKRANEAFRGQAPRDPTRTSRPPPPPPVIPAPPKAGYAPPMPARTRTPHVYPPPPPMAVAPPLRPLPATIATRKGPTSTLPLSVQRVLDTLAADLAPGSPRRFPILAGGGLLVAVFLGTLVTLVWGNVNASRQAAAAAAHASASTMVASPPAPTTVPVIVVTPAPVRPQADAGATAASVPPKGKVAPPPPPTLERAAVDALSTGDVPGALAAYRELARAQPDNPAFAQAVRALEGKTKGP